MIAFEGVADRNAAEALKGTELFVDRAALPQPDEDEFYHADLIGLEARDSEGRVLGKVSAIHNYGASDVIEIAARRRRSCAARLQQGDRAGAQYRGRLYRCRRARRRDDEDVPSDMRRSWPECGLRSSWHATVLTLFPEMFPGPLGISLLGKALEKNLWSLDVRDIRDHGLGKHRTVDDTPAGGGPGMVMRADVAAAAIDAVRATADAPADLSVARAAPARPRRGCGHWRRARARSCSAAGSRGWTSG